MTLTWRSVECGLCRTGHPDDSDRCDTEREAKPITVSNAPGTVAKDVREALEHRLSSTSSTMMRPVGVSLAVIPSASPDGHSTCREVACARVRELPAAVDTAMGRSVTARELRGGR